MASPPVSSSTSLISRSFSPFLSRSHRLPLVGAICFLSLGLTTLSSSPFRLLKPLSIRAMSSNTTDAATVPSIVVYVTVPNKNAGVKLAHSIVKEKLAACVNRVPGVESVYEWKGEIQTDSEELLIIKTRESLLEPLKEHVKENHEYDVPEVIALPIVGGSEPYLEWIKSSTRD